MSKSETAGSPRVFANEAPLTIRSQSRGPAIDPSHVRRCCTRYIATNSAEAIERAKYAAAHHVATEIAAKLIEHDYFTTKKLSDGTMIVKCDLDVIVPLRRLL